MQESPEAVEAWREELLLLQRELVALVRRLVEGPELPVEKEPGAAIPEPPGAEEPLATWILTDERVRAVERAIEQEQRVRGRVFYAPDGQREGRG